MSEIIAHVNEGTRLTNSRIRKFIPDLADWAVAPLLADIKANGGRNVNGFYVYFAPFASTICNTQGQFIICEYREPAEVVDDNAGAARKVYETGVNTKGATYHVVAADTLTKGDVLAESGDVIRRVTHSAHRNVFIYLEGRELPTIAKATNRYRVLASI
jgi:hypothetical protein